MMSKYPSFSSNLKRIFKCSYFLSKKSFFMNYNITTIFLAKEIHCSLRREIVTEAVRTDKIFSFSK